MVLKMNKNKILNINKTVCIPKSSIRNICIFQIYLTELLLPYILILFNVYFLR